MRADLIVECIPCPDIMFFPCHCTPCPASMSLHSMSLHSMSLHSMSRSLVRPDEMDAQTKAMIATGAGVVVAIMLYCIWQRRRARVAARATTKVNLNCCSKRASSPASTPRKKVSTVV